MPPLPVWLCGWLLLAKLGGVQPTLANPGPSFSRWLVQSVRETHSPLPIIELSSIPRHSNHVTRLARPRKTQFDISRLAKGKARGRTVRPTSLGPFASPIKPNPKTPRKAHDFAFSLSICERERKRSQLPSSPLALHDSGPLLPPSVDEIPRWRSAFFSPKTFYEIFIKFLLRSSISSDLIVRWWWWWFFLCIASTAVATHWLLIWFRLLYEADKLYSLWFSGHTDVGI